MPKHGIIVVDGSGTTYLIHNVKIGNKRYSVSPYSCMSNYFFAVRHLGVVYTDRGPETDPRGKNGRTTYYFSPDAYFSANHMPKEDEMEEVEQKHRVDLIKERLEYKQKHKPWYDLHENIKANPEDFIHNKVRSNI